MIFHLKAAQNLIAEHNRRDFDMIFHLTLETAEKKLGWTATWKEFSHDFPL